MKDHQNLERVRLTFDRFTVPYGRTCDDPPCRCTEGYLKVPIYIYTHTHTYIYYQFIVIYIFTSMLYFFFCIRSTYKGRRSNTTTEKKIMNFVGRIYHRKLRHQGHDLCCCLILEISLLKDLKQNSRLKQVVKYLEIQTIFG